MQERWTKAGETKPWKIVCGSLAATLTLLLSPAHAASTGDPLAAAGRWEGATRGNASTPPMGWNSWNAFRTEVDEAKVIGAAQALVDSGLAKLGYRHVTSMTAGGSSAARAMAGCRSAPASFHRQPPVGRKAAASSHSPTSCMRWD